MYHTAVGGSMNIKAEGANKIKETAGEIHLNTSGQAAGSSADAAASSPVAADSAVLASVGKPAYVAETMTLLVTDLPNPTASDPPLIDVDSHGLALNENKTGGTGGENIRNLQDLLSDMSSGVVAHTLKPSVAAEEPTLEFWVGSSTAGFYGAGSGTAGIWDGYSDQLETKDQYVLGPRSLSTIRRFHGWIEDGDVADKKGVTWNCTIDSTRP